MRALRIRRTIWTLNLVLGVPFCVLGAWSAVRAAPSPPPPPDAAARRAVTDLDRALRAATPARFAASVDRDLLHEVLGPEDPSRWFPLSGPIQPPPPPPRPPRPVAPPTLGKHATVRIVIGGPGSWQLTLRFTDGSSVIARPGDVLRIPGGSLAFRLLRVEARGRGRYRVVYRCVGADASQALVVELTRRAGANDPIRPLRPPPPAQPAGRASEPRAGRVGTRALAEGIRVERRGSRRIVHVGPDAMRALRGDPGRRILEDVKTREVALPGGVGGIQIQSIGVKAQVLHRVTLRNGDVLIRVNDVPTPTRGTLVEVLRGLPEDTRRVTVDVDRNGRRLRYELEVPARAGR